MYMLGRWVPLEVVNTIFILWGVSVAVLVFVVFWLGRRRRTVAGKRKRPRRVSGKRRTWRFKR
jgi:cytochrome c-type biogenesis protein CcmH/NrfF